MSNKELKYSKDFILPHKMVSYEFITGVPESLAEVIDQRSGELVLNYIKDMIEANKQLKARNIELENMREKDKIVQKRLMKKIIRLRAERKRRAVPKPSSDLMA